MALTYRLYRTLRIGTGTKLDPYRSKLCNYIVQTDTPNSQVFEDWIHMFKPVRYAFAYCDSTVHTTIAADPDVMVLSPEGANVQDIRDWLTGQLGGSLNSVLVAIDSDNIPTDDFTSTTPRSALLRRIAMYHSVMSTLRGDFRPALTIFSPYKDVLISDVPVEVRNVGNAYLQSRGIDTSQFTGSTPVMTVINTVRDIRDKRLSFLTANLDATVGDLNQNIRQFFNDWLIERGIDTASITLATPIRKVLKDILGILNINPARFIKLVI